jgi:hypothetical protein
MDRKKPSRRKFIANRAAVAGAAAAPGKKDIKERHATPRLSNYP